MATSNPRNRLGSKNPSLLARAVKQARAEQGLTQMELADRAGVSLFFIRQFEQGKRSVRLDLVERLLEFLGLELKVGPRLPGAS